MLIFHTAQYFCGDLECVLVESEALYELELKLTRKPMAAMGGEDVEDVEGVSGSLLEDCERGGHLCWVCQEAASLQCPQSGGKYLSQLLIRLHSGSETTCCLWRKIQLLLEANFLTQGTSLLAGCTLLSCSPSHLRLHLQQQQQQVDAACRPLILRSCSTYIISPFLDQKQK